MVKTCSQLQHTISQPALTSARLKQSTCCNLLLAAAAATAVLLQVSEDQLKGMLEQISEREAATSKITIQRRRPVFDDDD